METIDALWLGIVQGLAEYLPISSSGHLAICRDILHINMQGSDALEFDLILHIATVLSTIVVLWRQFVPLCTSFITLRRDENTIYVLKLLLSAIPVAVVGLLFKDTIEQLFGTNLSVVGSCLIVTSALLAFAYYFRRSPAGTTPSGHQREHDITWLDAFVIGCAQAVAVLPGLSRSGSTIATGLILGDRRDRLAQFSFFMVIIPILGEMLLIVKDMISGEATSAASIGITPLVVGFLSAFIVGCFACRWMISLVSRGKLVWFALYCVIIGLLCLLW